ncbi:MAG: LPS-assembly protein LptD [Betaproteobacteria bacterium]|nr:MAG: LPS-assembly protein LptD [Betaproteobacteria bacterium]
MAIACGSELCDFSIQLPESIPPSMQQRRARGPVVGTSGLAMLLILVLVAPRSWAQVAPSPAKAAGPTTIEALSIEGISEFEVTARGQVELRRDNLGIYSELLRYNREFGRVEADGGVRIERDGDRFFGSRLRFDLNSDTGVFEQPRFILRRTLTARGSAERLEFLGQDRIRLVGGSFTTCEPGREDWRFEARELELDYEAGEGRLRDGRLRFFDTTLLAIPRGTFPLENRRKSGFLTPHYSQNTRRGLEISVPYYWNIAPERDLTLTPVYMSKRGPQLKTQYRYLDARYDGDLRWEYLPEDKVLGTARSGLTYRHDHRFAPDWVGHVDFNRVSDDRYLVDMSSQVRQITLGNLNREGFMRYSGTAGATHYFLQGRVQRFQTLQDPLAPIVSPYNRAPQFNAGVTRQDIGGRLDLSMPAEYVRFTHHTLVEGARLSFGPTLSMPLLAPGHFVTPRLGLHYADYRLSRVAPGQAERQSVTVPWASLDAGLVFERSANLFGGTFTQTLEPRLFYAYAPFRAQDAVPLFDTGLADFNYAQLFSENRFAGGDRFGDANQVTLAVTSRLLEANGEEHLRATVGQRYYFKDERVGLTPATPLNGRGQSDILAAVGGRVAQHWSFDGAFQYDPQQSRTERYSASVRYTPEIAKMVSASYRFNRDALRQIDVAAQWPIAPGWYAVGRYNYSLLERRLLEGIAGVEYNAGCWVFRTVFQRLQAAAQTTSTALMFQLEFNGFGGIRSGDVVEFLKRQVPGYAVTNPGSGDLVPPGLRQRLPFEQVY